MANDIPFGSRRAGASVTADNEGCTDEGLVFCGAAEDLFGAMPQPVAWDSASRARVTTRLELDVVNRDATRCLN